jgi:hypothetical protein
MFNLDDGGKFRWNWEKGAATDCADFGNPALTTDYDVCVYDQVEPGQYELATSLHLPANPVWESRNSCDWIYLDKTQSIDGIRRFTLHPGSAGKSAIRLFATGANTPMPTPVAADRFFAMDPNVTVQLISSTGACWESEFSGAYRNNGTKFRSRRVP